MLPRLRTEEGDGAATAAAPHVTVRCDTMRIRHPYAILALLSALNLLNYLDRLLISAVGPKLTRIWGSRACNSGWSSTPSCWAISSPVRSSGAGR